MLSRLKNRFVSHAGTLSAISDGAVISLAGVGDTDILLVPAEQVLTFAVALPLPSHRRRIEALPFAIEDRIAAPTDTVHLALAGEPTDGLYLASVVEPAIMAAWVGLAAAAGLDDAAIMPDALALPLPVAGHWTVMRQPGGRILTRRPDGGGFAVAEPNFVPLWTIAGKPICDELRQFPDDVRLAINLRQGAYAAERGSIAVPLRRLAAVSALGLLAHGAIAAADIAVLQSIAAKRGVAFQAQFAKAAPGVYPGTDPADAAIIASGMLPAGPVSAPGPMIPLLNRTSQALAPMGGALGYRAISFAEQNQQLRLDVEADSATLGRARQALASAGLTVRIEGGSIIVGGEVKP